MEISSLDKNLAVAEVDERGIVYYDVRRKPFAIYGLIEHSPYRRMPGDIAMKASAAVADLSHCTAGGRVRFSTDSSVIVLKAKMHRISRMPHMPLSGTAGFDMYIDLERGESRHCTTFMPPMAMTDGYSSEVRFAEKKMRSFTLNFPLYAGVLELYLGFEQGATIGEGKTYLDEKPVVYYGSSITQGGCASRPGNSYQSIICRRTELDYVNLGFSGNGKGEDAMIEYLASLDMCAFVSDYDHNAPNAEHLKRTHMALYRAVREKHPDIPYVMVSKCDIDSGYGANIIRRDVIYGNYRDAREDGDGNVYFVDGESIFRGKYAEMCTVDGVHPTDLGMALLADAIEGALRRGFTQNQL